MLTTPSSTKNFGVFFAEEGANSIAQRSSIELAQGEDAFDRGDVEEADRRLAIAKALNAELSLILEAEQQIRDAPAWRVIEHVKIGFDAYFGTIRKTRELNNVNIDAFEDRMNSIDNLGRQNQFLLNSYESDIANVEGQIANVNSLIVAGIAEEDQLAPLEEHKKLLQKRINKLKGG